MASGEQTAPQLPKCITCPTKQGPLDAMEATSGHPRRRSRRGQLLWCWRATRALLGQTTWTHKGPPNGQGASKFDPGTLLPLSRNMPRTGS